MPVAAPPSNSRSPSTQGARAFAVDEFLSLEDVSARTGVSIRRLRQWCATGLLRCEPAGAAWMIAGSEVDRVRQLAAGQDHRIKAGHPIAIVVPAESAPPNLADEVARRLGLAPTTVAMSSLAIDGQDYLVAVWKDSDGAGGLPALAELIDEVGGAVLDASAEEPGGPAP